ncbi:hypothetical protein NA57DRAFT_75301 [Rhizodiscina lignyota]|uniref:Cyclochlorotine biosynthesis protein O n=1 Tax=Rhizodiscina lignyota TaxID=1504668 RepID=A0A9P4IKF7_9PEZI|nr:hypothetical protein NA57DRAFT_75301 [Rhizodiscina lignyota]
MSKLTGYQKLPVTWKEARSESDEEGLPFLDHPTVRKVEDSGFLVRQAIRYPQVWVPWILVASLVGFIVYQNTIGPSELACTRLLNPYSPLIEAGVVSYYDTEFENEFAHKTKYRGPPTPELEEAWDQLWNRGAFEVSLDGPARLNKSGESLKHVHWDQKRGYSALMEGFISFTASQYTWKDYYAKHNHLMEWMHRPENKLKVDLNVTHAQDVGDRMHVDHCIETLRLQLMCNGDVTPLLINVDSESPLGSSADFNTHHKCRDWNKLVEWQDKHNIDMETRS